MDQYNRHQVQFSGKAGEYFGIWIVNILLTIVTIGIYSAWAKVRTNRYFYGNTSVDGHAFEYHATGKQILIGRIIVFAAFALYSGLGAINPFLAIALLLVYLGLFPLLICRGLRFARRVTSYRNVRFDFNGTYGGAFWAMILLPILNVFTLYIATPYVSRALANFIIKNSTYGGRPFDVDMPVGPLYKALAITLTLIFGTVLLIGGTLFGMAGGDFFQLSVMLESNPLLFIVPYIVFILLIFVAYPIYTVAVRNTTYNHMSLDGRHRFGSTIDTKTYIVIALTNAIAVIFTLGLLSPWARVRMTKYLASETTLLANGPLDNYVSNVRTESGVIGDEFMDMEGVDVGLGV